MAVLKYFFFIFIASTKFFVMTANREQMSTNDVPVFKTLHTSNVSVNDSNLSGNNRKISSNSTENAPWKILVTHPQVPRSALDLMGRSCELIICQSVPTDRNEILSKAHGVDALYWASHELLDAEVLDVVGPQLKAITTMSAGFDFVDIDELRARKIPLGHTPTVLNNAVADVAIGLMITAARRFKEGYDTILKNSWKSGDLNWMLGQDIVAATVGFFGFGNIGQTIAKRLKGFDISRIVYNTRYPLANDIEKRFNASHVTFDNLLALSDILFIAAPLVKETTGVFNASAFAKMKPTAVLINVARGGIIKQEDLYHALENNEIFAAGLDVMTPEPLPSNHPLLRAPNCVLTPHIGSATTRTRNDMATIAAHNVLRGLAGEPMFAPAY